MNQKERLGSDTNHCTSKINLNNLKLPKVHQELDCSNKTYGDSLIPNTAGFLLSGPRKSMKEMTK